MSRTFDKEIISSVIQIFEDDNTNPDSGEYCINFFVRDRIYHAAVPIDVTEPYITVDFSMQGTDDGLPAQEAELYVDIWYKVRETIARTRIRECGARVIDLLDRNPSAINSKGFNAKVRTITKQTAYLLPPQDERDEMLHYSITFSLIFGDTWSG